MRSEVAAAGEVFSLRANLIYIGGKPLLGQLVIVHRKTQLAEIALALTPPRGLSRRLNGWQKQSDKNADDGDYNEKLNECEAADRLNLAQRMGSDPGLPLRHDPNHSITLRVPNSN